jgi:hypothetical protein
MQGTIIAPESNEVSIAREGKKLNPLSDKQDKEVPDFVCI